MSNLYPDNNGVQPTFGQDEKVPLTSEGSAPMDASIPQVQPGYQQQPQYVPQPGYQQQPQYAPQQPQPGYQQQPQYAPQQTYNPQANLLPQNPPGALARAKSQSETTQGAMGAGVICYGIGLVLGFLGLVFSLVVVITGHMATIDQTTGDVVQVNVRHQPGIYIGLAFNLIQFILILAAFVFGIISLVKSNVPLIGVYTGLALAIFILTELFTLLQLILTIVVGGPWFADLLSLFFVVLCCGVQPLCAGAHLKNKRKEAKLAAQSA